jgi:Dyp-type peroxidase family
MPIFDPDSDLVTGPVVPGAPPEPVLRIQEIQGNILPGFNTLHQVLVGVTLDTGQANGARAWLAWLLPSISTLAQVNDFRNVRRRALRRGDPRPPSPVWTNVAVSIRGLQLLAPSVAAITDSSFTQGMAALSGDLGDPRDPAEEGHVSRWVVGGGGAGTPDVLVILACDQAEELGLRAEEVRRSLAEHKGVALVYEQTGEVLPGDREHFGFRDGITAPGVRGRLSENERHFLTRRYVDPADPRARGFSRPGHPLVWPGQFIFGYARQDTEDPETPGPVAHGGEEWMADGSYLVLRRLRQDVPRFHAFLTSEVQRLRERPGFADLTSGRLAALMVGRWPEGTALMRNPQGDDPDPMGDRLSVNHFAFAEPAVDIRVCADPHVSIEPLVEPASGTVQEELRAVTGAPADPFGGRCPRFAHVRKVNPRDLQTDQGGPDHTLALQVLRRGITWGAPYPDDAEAREADDGDRGLLFLCYQTSIEEQFEVLNSRWMNREIGPEGEAGHDLLVGQSRGAPARRAVLRSEAGGREEIRTRERWVIPTGGGYFFAPSLSALRTFAGVS